MSFFDVAYQSGLPIMLPKEHMAKANSALETTKHPIIGRMNATIRFFVWGVMPIIGCLVWGVMPISALLAGAFATWFGLVSVFWVGAIGALLATWFIIASPLRGLQTIVPKSE